nr:MAG TPA: hypothetical protein [Caudoviricetes sp.]
MSGYRLFYATQNFWFFLALTSAPIRETLSLLSVADLNSHIFPSICFVTVFPIQMPYSCKGLI